MPIIKYVWSLDKEQPDPSDLYLSDSIFTYKGNYIQQKILENQNQVNHVTQLSTKDKEGLKVRYPLSRDISKKYFQDGKYTDTLLFYPTPTGKIITVGNWKKSDIEIDSFASATGPEMEEKVLNFFLKIGIPADDILLPYPLDIPGVGESQFSDGVIIFGSTAFLIQMKHRDNPSEREEVSTDTMKAFEKLVSKAKKQYYDSLQLAEENHSGVIEMKTLGGSRRHIILDDYNWRSLILINKNYYSETDKKSKLSSWSKSPSIKDKEEVNHIILLLQGLLNIHKIFKNSTLLFAFLLRLSNQRILYELDKESYLIEQSYGQLLALEDNVMRFHYLVHSHINFLFSNNSLNKRECENFLFPLTANKDEDFLLINESIYFNFIQSSTNNIYFWKNPFNAYSIIFDYNGTSMILSRKETKHD